MSAESPSQRGPQQAPGSEKTAPGLNCLEINPGLGLNCLEKGDESGPGFKNIEKED